jgi:hypothetical protein
MRKSGLILIKKFLFSAKPLSSDMNLALLLFIPRQAPGLARGTDGMRIP